MTLLELKVLKLKDPQAFTDFCTDELDFGQWVKLHIEKKLDGTQIVSEENGDKEDFDGMMNVICNIFAKIEP